MTVKENQIFERLTTKYIIGKTKNKSNIWHCECSCGNEVDVWASSLVRKTAKSCVCLRMENLRKTVKENRKFNRYDLTNKYGIGYTAKNEEFYFDLEDYDKIKNYTWHCNDKKYVTTKFCGKRIRLHRLIMNVIDNKKYDIVDHKDRNPLNNRKENLRICEPYQNSINSSMYSNNTSGRKGVYWDKSKNKWRVLLNANKCRYDLGMFENFEDAVIAREKAEKTHHKKFTGQTQFN